MHPPLRILLKIPSISNKEKRKEKKKIERSMMNKRIIKLSEYT